MSNKFKNNSKAVRFAAEDESRPAKRARIDRPNVDEDDDVDEWINDEKGDDADLPSERDLMDAKRKRRMKRQGTDSIDDDEDDGNVEEDDDEPTSLMAERKQQQQKLNSNEDMAAEIPVEPFNMKAERSDGSGYFEGDTYIFRKRDEEGEPDAWLDSLNDDNDDKKGSQLAKPRVAAERTRDNNMDDWTREELYATILPLVSDSETILQALVRYGDLIKRQKKAQSQQSSSNGSASSSSLSQRALSKLTEASNALLLQGDVDIYQKTRQAIMKMVLDIPPPTPKVVVQWEYKGNQDDEVHGPYSTADMLGWTQTGYFIGAQAVQIRTVQKYDVATTNSSAEESPKTTAEDLLSDLMDDDDVEAKKEPPAVRGEWVSSNDINFRAYA